MATQGMNTIPDLIEVLETPLDTLKYINSVKCSSAGGIAVFIGTTRETFDGKRVMRLEYEAYRPMALRKLNEVRSKAREKWELTHIALAHRTGLVQVGEASVIVVVSSTHRKEALEACAFAIDEIKAKVPIWKKEVYEDGSMWKANKEFTEIQRC